ncbi:MAG: bifunctional hydroxymethylpyrimidine kinase/phosphomethylpyrimidine kinase [Gammaproteobacteria bacterium]|nr:bifunctional hydroxymethylpyrimidine kinase/phosphomethylpyrimidine kinase [Gammaproteobacteria bacterium]
MKTVLAIAGSDSSGGAGLQCDVKTVSSLGLHAQTVVTSVTSQTNEEVCSLDHVAPLSVQRQLTSTFNNHQVNAVKSGMIPTAESVFKVSTALQEFHDSKPYVLDPVFKSTSGTTLIMDAAAQAMLECLFPLATLVTPNVSEAEKLSGIKILSPEDAVRAGRKLLEHACRYVLIKGGHLIESPGLDILVGPNVDTPPEFVCGFEFAENRNVHGTGCAYATAISCGLASDLDVVQAVHAAKHYITRAILNATQLANGSWILNHKLAGSHS